MGPLVIWYLLYLIVSFLPLLAAEQDEAENVLKQRLATWSLNRLKEDGYCLTELSAYWVKENQFGRPVASFSLGPGVILPENRFEYVTIDILCMKLTQFYTRNGTQVLISRIDPLREEPKKGSVLSRTSSSIRVSFNEGFDLEDSSWRLDLGQSQMVYDRMREALAALHHNPEIYESLSPGADRELILQGTYLRDVLLRTFSTQGEPHAHAPLQAPDEVEYASQETLDHGASDGNASLGVFKDDQRIHSWAARYSRLNPLVVEGDPRLQGLNGVQIRAMATMIMQKISLIQGVCLTCVLLRSLLIIFFQPPGTGKTKTIIETIKLLKVPLSSMICYRR